MKIKEISKPLDPDTTMCVVKHDGKEVGRMPATARNASDYISNICRVHGNCQVDYETDEDAGFIASLFNQTKPPCSCREK